MDARRNIAYLIRSARLRKGLSQASCAASVGVSRQMWINYENAKSVPVESADAIAELLGIPRGKLNLPRDKSQPSKAALRLAALIDELVEERVVELARAAA